MATTTHAFKRGDSLIKLSKQTKKLEQRYLDVLRDSTALIDGWKCPVCNREFRDQDACPHGWNDVSKANDKFLLSYSRQRALLDHT
jgi:hypothetical protein